MGLISFGGLGSGLDVNSIVDAIVQAERAPQQLSLDRRESTIQIQISGLGALKSAISDLRSSAFDLSLASTFNKRKTSISSSEYYSASASSSALPGSYDIEVTSLAQGSKLSTNVFTGGSTTTFGAGTLTFTIGSDSFDVDVLSTDTLADIQGKINDAAGNSNVSVNLLNNVTVGPDTGSILTIKSDATGTGNDLVVTYSGDASLADLSTNLNTDQSATDASLKIDGFSVSSSTNTFTSLVDGVDITVIKENVASETSQLTVSLDTASVKSKIQSFVDALNNYADISAQLGQAADNGQGDVGILVGDYTLRQADSTLRNALTTSVSGAAIDLNNLSSLGISTKRDGTFEINSSMLNSALENNFSNLDELFSGDDGFASKFVDIIDNYSGSKGVINSRLDSLNGQLGKITEQRADVEYRISLLEDRLREQFAAMDAAVAQFNSTGSYLAQQLANLPGFSSNKKNS